MRASLALILSAGLIACGQQQADHAHQPSVMERTFKDEVDERNRLVPESPRIIALVKAEIAKNPIEIKLQDDTPIEVGLQPDGWSVSVYTANTCESCLSPSSAIYFVPRDLSKAHLTGHLPG